MSRDADFEIPHAGRGRVAPILLLIPLLLIGTWVIAAPLLAPPGAGGAHEAAPTMGGVAGHR